jgi:hypothetical protein
MSRNVMATKWENWLPRVAVVCAVLVPLLLIWTFSIHVPGDRCSFAAANRPGLAERHLLWAFALSAALVAVGISMVGLSRRRWSWTFVLAGFVGELAIVLIAALGLDPCGLS